MLDPLNGWAVGILAASCVYLLVYAFGETRKLAHIPSLGFSDPLLSYISAVRFFLDAPGYLRRAWREIPPGTQFVKVPGLMRWVVVGTRPEHYKDIASAPESKMTLRKATEEFLQGRYTMFDEEIGDNLHVAPIRDKLNKSLGDLVPEVYDETKVVFQDEFPLSEQVEAVRGYADNYQDYCKDKQSSTGWPSPLNPDYIDTCINYAVSVFIMSHVLSVVPPFLRSSVNWLVSPIPKRVKKMTGFLQPLINARKKGESDASQDTETMLSWLAELAESNGKDDRDIILRTMSLNFGSIHTTSLSFTHALFSLLSRPECVDAARAEAERCIREEGWTRAAMDKMRFLDSFMKETQRYEVLGAISGQRMVAEDCMLSGVFIPKGTMVGTNAIDAQFDQDMFGSNAFEFDPNRFIKLEETTGKRIQLPTSTLHTLTFGYGRHACPGRFFAAQEMKLLIAYFLIHYDLKLDNKDGKRPKNLWLGAFNMPNGSAKVLIRKRQIEKAPM
ncbi:hypothetical protein NMY22_g7312 [Coprinellus aureogranulatus]|nr:hypothetical protein NMY22_g7312 [Coprinellus aureogranulatus]